jgi:diguanylate cyclase (GGDEF)-like protein
MELRIYLRILFRKWWIVLSAFLVTFTSTVVFTYTQAPIYSATATFVVTPTSSFEDLRSWANGLEILSRRTEIATTYTEVAISRLIRSEASDALNLSQSQIESLSVSSKLRAGTNVLEIMVEGTDPVVTRDFANMVGARTMAYVQDLYETYSLSSLDLAALPNASVRPNKLLNLALGAAFGMALGMGLAFLSAYLQTPLGDVATSSIFDGETGAHNMRYFRQRLGEEMSRSRRNGYPLSIALMNVDHHDMIRSHPRVRGDALLQVAVVLKQYLREEDIIARFGGTVFAFLFPDVSAGKAKAMLAELEIRLAWAPFEIEKSGVKLNLSGVSTVVAYQQTNAMPDELLNQAKSALQQAEATSNGKVSMFVESPIAEQE